MYSNASRKKQRTQSDIVNMSLDDDDMSQTEEFVPLPPPFAHAGVDSDVSELCRSFLKILTQLGETTGGLYKPSPHSTEMFELKRVIDSKGISVQVIHRTENQDLKKAANIAIKGIKTEISKRREDIKALAVEVAALESQIRRRGDDSDALAVQLIRLLQMQGRHEEKIKELESLNSVEVVAEVERRCVSAQVRLAATETTVSKEQRTVSLLEPNLVVLGGHGGDYLSSVERFDPQQNAFRALPAMLTARSDFAAAVANGQLYALGGKNTTGNHLSSVERYDPVKKCWELMAPMQTSRHYLAAVALDEHIYAIGGHDSKHARAPSMVERYDVAKNEWSVMAPLRQKRRACAAAVLEGKIFVVGGYDGTELNSVEVYDVKANRWEVAPHMLTKRTACSAAVLRGQLYVMGGNDGTQRLSSVERYDPKDNKWEEVAPLTCVREGSSATVVNGQLMVTGGASVPGWILSSVETYDPDLNTWREIGPHMRSQRWGHAAVSGYFSNLRADES